MGAIAKRLEEEGGFSGVTWDGCEWVGLVCATVKRGEANRANKTKRADAIEARILSLPGWDLPALDARARVLDGRHFSETRSATDFTQNLPAILASRVPDMESGNWYASSR